MKARIEKRGHFVGKRRTLCFDCFSERGAGKWAADGFPLPTENESKVGKEEKMKINARKGCIWGVS